MGKYHMNSPNKFNEGDVYFAITYVDSELLFPIIRSLVFIGTNIEGSEEKDQWYFQDVRSYCDSGAVTFTENTDANEQVEVHRFDRSGLSVLFDFEGLKSDMQGKVKGSKP